jgi:carbon-monoxide dehydrogenase large subunit
MPIEQVAQMSFIPVGLPSELGVGLQGAGQALSEDIVYDESSGQLLTGTLMDYGIPRADTLPAVNVDFSPVPSTTNPLGAKGVGEGGTVASTPTVMNAILNALSPLGVSDVSMPATPERIWRAIRENPGR